MKEQLRKRTCAVAWVLTLACPLLAITPPPTSPSAR